MSKRECKSYRTLISAYLDGDCDPGEEDRLFAHLAICAECHAILDSYQGIRSGLRELPRVAPPPQLAREIRRATIERPPATIWGRFFGMSGLRWGLSTVGALAILIVGLTVVMVHGYNATLDPSITSSAPATQQEWPTTQPIRIEFSKPMDHASVESSLRISPPGERDRLPMSWSGNTLIIGADGTRSVTLLPDTDYTIVVLADARDQNGNPLGSVWTLRFHTGHSTSALAQAPDATPSPVDTSTPAVPGTVARTGSAKPPASVDPTAPPSPAAPPTVPPVALVPPSMVVTPPPSQSTQPTPVPARTQPPATTAARQAPTPVATTTPAPSTPTPTPAPAAVATTQPTPATTAAPAPEATVVPTQEPQPTQAAPTTVPAQTPTPTSSNVPVVGALGSVYWSHGEVQAKLGAPTAAEVKVNTAELSFQHGLMYERYDTGTIYILLTGGQWSEATDTWVAGDPVGGAACGNPSDNLFQPTKGFFKIWDSDAKLQAALGCAVQQTTTLAANNVQRFANGELLYGDQGFVYVVYDDGTWAVYPDTSGHGTLLTPTPTSGQSTPPVTVTATPTQAGTAVSTEGPQPTVTATSTSTP